MLRKTIYLLFLLLSIHLSGQTLTWGSKTDYSSQKQFEEFLGEANGNVYALGSDAARRGSALWGAKYYLLIYDKNGNFKSAVDMPSPKTPSGKETDFETIELVNGQLQLYSSFFNKDTKKEQFYKTTLTADGGLGTSIMIAERPLLKKKNGGMRVASDRNNTVHFIYDLNHESQTLFAHLSDSKGKKIWQREFSVKGEEAEWIRKVFVADDESVYCMVEHKDGHQSLWALDGQASPNITSKMPIGDRSAITVVAANYSFDPENNTLILAGLYNDEPDTRKEPLITLSKASDYVEGSEVNGVFYEKIDLDNLQKQDFIKTEFTTEFINLFSRPKKVDDGFIVDITKIQLLPDKQNGIFLVGEQQHTVQTITTTTTTTRAGQTTSTSITERSTYGDILVIRLDDQGKPTWETRLNKSQVLNTRNDKFSSMEVNEDLASYKAWVNASGQLNILFNDVPENIDRNDGPIEFYGGEPKINDLVLATIADGKVSKKSIASKDKDEVRAYPPRTQQVSDGSFVLFGGFANGVMSKKKDYKIGRMQ